jgi:chemotaxis protein MotB
MSDILDGPETRILRRRVRQPMEPQGVAWKVAYVDVAAAMLAFFLLFWLLSVSADYTKRGISDFFLRTGEFAQAKSNAGPLESLAMTVKRIVRSIGSPRVTVVIPTFGDDATPGYGGNGHAAETDKRLWQAEQRNFLNAATALRRDPELAQMQDSLLIDQTRDGLRIQLLDSPKDGIFQDGSAQLTPRGRQMLAIVGPIVAQLPNRIAVNGHTDSSPRPKSGKQPRTPPPSKWELSGERADNARRALMEAGVPGARFARVVAKADREPLGRRRAPSSNNDRIGILLLGVTADRGQSAGTQASGR